MPRPGRYSKFPEAAAWIIALLIPIFIDPAETNFSFCFFKGIGLSWCPGCGLGTSIAFLYRGAFAASFHAHPLGIFAVLILLHRIISLIFIKNNKLINSPHT